MALTTKKAQVTRNPQTLHLNEAKPAEQKPVVEAPTFYPAEDDIKKPFVNERKPKPTNPRASITPGTVFIILAGRFKGKRVVFLKQLKSGMLLVSGSFEINDGSLYRVNRADLIATSTKVDISGVIVDKGEGESSVAFLWIFFAFSLMMSAFLIWRNHAVISVSFIIEVFIFCCYFIFGLRAVLTATYSGRLP